MKFRKLKFKILAATLLFTAILCAIFIRIIPDYSTSRGFAIVSLPDYDKYKQGYCTRLCDSFSPRLRQIQARILPKRG